MHNKYFKSYNQLFISGIILCVCQCNDCEKTLCHKESLRRHKFNAHNCVKCDQCDVVLKKPYMKKHKLWEHEHKKL